MDFFIGQVISLGFSRAPQGFMRCDGTLLQIAPNEALYTLLGNNYGGDGHTTFGVPNLTATDKATGLYSFISLQGQYPQFG